jgi:CMP-N-acetylneuraminic acid synthetase
MSRRFVMNEKRYFSGKSFAYILPLKRTINIDDENDLLIARKKLQK